MKTQHAIYGIYLLMSISGYSEELHFSNDIEWIRGFKGGWELRYTFDPSYSTSLGKSPVEFSDGKFHFEMKAGPVAGVLLFHDNIYVCHLKRDKNDRMLVPRLSNVTFDLRELPSLVKDEWIAIQSMDESISSFHLGVEQPMRVDRLIERGQVLMVSVTTPKTNVEIGVVLIADADRGVVKLSGDFKSEWSLSASWIPKKAFKVKK